MPERLIARLEAAAKHIGMGNRTDVMKLCLISFLDYYEGHGYESLRPIWPRIIAEIDGRTREHAEAQLRVAEDRAEYGKKGGSK